MPAAARVNDPIGHAPGVSTGTLSGPGVTTVLIEGKAAAVLGTPVTCSKPKTLTTTDGPQLFLQSSKSVFIGGAPALRVNDRTQCGATILLGAQRVVIGG
jgi:uncharacterized Zn-binding protein involved in type VI secretion